MSLFIITDSASDVVDKSREDLIVLPLKVRFDDGNEYLDGVNITHQEFYEKLLKMVDLMLLKQKFLIQKHIQKWIIW